MELPFMYRNTIRVSLAAFGFILPVLVSAQSFEIVDMGMEHPAASLYPDVAVRSTSSGAHAISDGNVVVGSIEYWQAPPAFHDQHPFISCEGCSSTVIDRSWLTAQDTEHGVATSISSSGEYMAGYAGNYYDPRRTGWHNRAGFVMHQGKVEMLHRPSLPDWAGRPRYSHANDVNDYGEAVGFAGDTAVVWRGGDFELLGPGIAYGINNSGQIIVGGWGGGYVLWQDNTRYDLGFEPRAINELGQVVGWRGEHAVLWDDGAIQVLGMLPGEQSSYAYDINHHGEIVGNSKPAIDDGLRKHRLSIARPFLWQCGNMLDLNALIPESSGWELIDARGINNNGRIVGSGLKDGEVRAYMLKPVKGPGRGRDQGRGNGEPPVCPGSQGQGQGRG